MKRSELLSELHAMVMVDPSIVGDVIKVLTSGLHESLDKANRHAIDMETLFAMSALHGRLPTKPRDREYLATILEKYANQSRLNFSAYIKELRKTR